MNDLLDWAEKQGLENIRFRLQNAENLSKDAGSTLTILLAGMGGALAYAVKGLDQSMTAAGFGSAILSGWLMLAAAILVLRCIMSSDLPVPTNVPKNLYRKGSNVEVLRELELNNLQLRIEQVTTRNNRIAQWLDRVRLLAIVSPLIFLVATLAWAKI